MTLARKFLLPTFLVLTFAGVGLFVLFNFEFSLQLQTEEIRADRLMQQVFEARLQSLEELSQTLAAQAAGNPDVRAALTAGDRDALLGILHTISPGEASSGPVDYVFHRSPAEVFLRSDKPGVYGDDQSLTRPFVADAIAGNRTVQALYVDDSGLAVHTVVPIIGQGRVIGSVDVGLQMGYQLFEELKNEYGRDWQLSLARKELTSDLLAELEFSGRQPSPELVLKESTDSIPIFAQQETYQRLITLGAAERDSVVSRNRSYHLLSIPLKDYSGTVIGVVDIIQDRAALLQERNSRLLVAGGGLAIAVLLAWLASLYLFQRHFSVPIGKINSAAAEITSGNLAHRAPVTATDEIGLLAGQFNQLVDQYQGLTNEVDSRVAARAAEAERRATQIRTMAEVARDLASAQNLDELLKRAVDLIASRFGFYHVGVFLIDERKEHAHLVAATGEAGRKMLAQGHRLRVGQTGLVGYVTGTGKPRVSLDVEADTYHYRNPLLPQTASELVLPLRAANRLIGALDVQSTIVRAFQEEDITVLQILADQFAATIENIRIQESSVKAVQQSLQAGVEHAASAWAGLHRRHTATAYEYDGVNLQPSQRPLPADTIEELRLGRPVIQRVHPGEPGTPGSALIIPIRLRDQLLGMIGLEEQDPDYTWPGDIVTLAVEVAGQAAESLENARLYVETQEGVQRERLLSEISGRMQRSSSVEDLIARTVANMQAALGAGYAVVRLGVADGAASSDETRKD